jgi:hypothetical protein
MLEFRPTYEGERRSGDVIPARPVMRPPLGGSNKLDADPVGRTPFDVALSLDYLGLNQKREIVWNACGALDFQGCACVRKIANYAVNPGS